MFQYDEKAWKDDKQGCYSIQAVMPVYGAMSGFSLEQGRFLDPLDQQHAKRVIVLGNKAIEQLFPSRQAVGQSVKIAGLSYQVIGALKSSMSLVSIGMPADYSCYIPLSSYREVKPQDHFYELFISPNPGVHRKQLVDTIRQILLRHHGLDIDDHQQIQSYDARESHQSITKFLVGLQVFLGVIGFISLAVAGIGIANVMLVTVRRATRDIGVRMALGARDHHILLHYLLQAMITVCSGGLLGILMTSAIVWAVDQLPWVASFTMPLGNRIPCYQYWY